MQLNVVGTIDEPVDRRELKHVHVKRVQLFLEPGTRGQTHILHRHQSYRQRLREPRTPVDRRLKVRISRLEFHVDTFTTISLPASSCPSRFRLLRARATSWRWSFPRE